MPICLVEVQSMKMWKLPLGEIRSQGRALPQKNHEAGGTGVTVYTMQNEREILELYEAGLRLYHICNVMK